VAGAFYQAYLVREKGWGERHLRQGLLDSTLGIGILGGITLVIMTTSAAVFLGRAATLKDVADVARQLEPLFGSAALVLFSLGLFAAAFSSFMVNAMIGGTLLADGLGLGARIDGLWPKRLTALALVVGMGIAIPVKIAGEAPVAMIILAQSLTVLGMPVLAFSLLYLATTRDVRSRIPRWLIALVALGCLASIALAGRTVLKIWDMPSG
jgi:Mn2+/Fe2+ NRAMP family transporter